MWGRFNRQCDAYRQSPVNINTKLVRYRAPFRIKLQFRSPILRGRFFNSGMYHKHIIGRLGTEEDFGRMRALRISWPDFCPTA